MNLPDSLHVVGIRRRFLAEAVDAMVIFPVAIFVLLPVDYWALENRASWAVALVGICWLSVFAWFLVRFGATPGKLALRMRVVDSHGTYLRWRSAFLRETPAWVALFLATAAIGKASGSFDGFDGDPTFGQYSEAISVLGGPYATLQSWWTWFVCLDILAIAVNRNRRAIHDYIAGSVVVTKSSYMNTIELRPVGSAR
jgi:uncharacterized RDD family membrane protein YckC